MAGASAAAHVLLTDASPAMVRDRRGASSRPLGARRRASAPPSDLASWRRARGARDAAFDGAFSNFAALNCVTDLEPVARGAGAAPSAGCAGAAGALRHHVRRARWWCSSRGATSAAAFRRVAAGDVAGAARRREFTVRYHRARASSRAHARPGSGWRRAAAIGVFVPPSAAEPWISRAPAAARRAGGARPRRRRGRSRRSATTCSTDVPSGPYRCRRHDAPSRHAAAARFRRGLRGASRGRGTRLAGAAAACAALPRDRAPGAAVARARAHVSTRSCAACSCPMALASRRPLRLLDLGAGNGWLSHRAALAGCDATARGHPRRRRRRPRRGAGDSSTHLGRHFWRVAGSFEALPDRLRGSFDMVVFNAALHYATDLAARSAARRACLRPGGRLAILDSPFYRRAEDGQAMVAEKAAGGRDRIRCAGRRAADAAVHRVPHARQLAQCLARPRRSQWRRSRVRLSALVRAPAAGRRGCTAGARLLASTSGRAPSMILFVNPRATRPKNRRFPLSVMAVGAALPPRSSWEIVDGNLPGMDTLVELAATRRAPDARCRPGDASSRSPSCRGRSS